MRKIIFIPFIDAFGGVERLALSLARHLHECAVQCSIVCFSNSIDLASYADWPLDIVEILSPRNPVVEGWYLNLYLRRHYGKHVHSVLIFDLKGAFYAGMFLPRGYLLHLTDPPSLLPSDQSKNAPSITGRKVSSLNALRYELVHRLNGRGVRRAKNVIAMTNTIREEIGMLYGVVAKVVRPGIALPSSYFNYKFNFGNVHFLSVCRLEENKRLDWIIRAIFQMEHSSSPLSLRMNWTLDIVGRGSQEGYLKHLCSELGLTDRVAFHGKVSDEKLEALYGEATLFLMPAIQGYGLPALEALARNVPVVLHRQSGVSEILDDTPWVSIIEDNEDSLKDALAVMIERLLSQQLTSSNFPKIPTDLQWAQEICAIWV